MLLSAAPGRLDHLLEHLIRYRRLPDDALDHLDQLVDDSAGLPNTRLAATVTAAITRLRTLPTGPTPASG